MTKEDEAKLVKALDDLMKFFKGLTHPQSQEVYSDCKNPQGCVYCGGYCPYLTTKSLDE